MAETATRHLYLVQEILWEILFDCWDPIWEFEDSERLRPEMGTFRRRNTGQGRPVKLFADKEAAFQFRRWREAEAREFRNPFLHGEKLEDLTTMPGGIFHDWLVEADLQPPLVSPFDPTVWFQWWRDEKMTEEQRAKVWQALDKVRFFDVIQLEAPSA